MKIAFAWWVFIFLETLAVISAFTWEVAPALIGPALWVTQFFLLMPGSLLAAPIVEKALWMRGPSLLTIGFVEIAASVTTNAVVWFLCLQIIRRFRGTRVI
jgi:hypothetical protein